MPHKIGVISDTHGLLRPEVLEALAGCERILHAGDISSPPILERLEGIAPVTAIRGNNDGDWAADIPEVLSFEVCGLKAVMIHNKKQLLSIPDGTDLVICGHTHKYDERPMGGALCLNPGSCGPRRFHQEITMAILWVTEPEDGGKNIFRVEKISIPHPAK